MSCQLIAAAATLPAYRKMLIPLIFCSKVALHLIMSSRVNVSTPDYNVHQLFAKMRSNAALLAIHSRSLQIVHHCASLHMHHTMLLPGCGCRLKHCLNMHACCVLLIRGQSHKASAADCRRAKERLAMQCTKKGGNQPLPDQQR